MSVSLQDQLVQMGLARSEPTERPKKKPSPSTKAAKKSSPARDKRRQQTKKPQHKAKPSQDIAAQQQAEQQAAIAAEAQRKKIKAQIKALIEAHSVADWQGETPYNYQIGERIRQLLVSEQIRQGLVDGSLAVTRLNRHTHIVPSTLREQILALNPAWLFVASDQPPPAKDGDDPYADFTVPDDLVW